MSSATELLFGVKYNLAPTKPSVAAGEVYGAFGLEPEQGERVYVEPFSLTVKPGEIVAFVGASGGGKTTCLNQMQKQIGAFDLDLLIVDPGSSIIDQMVRGKTTTDQALSVAAACGLAEAQLLLRRPTELSDGQMYRFRMAMGLVSGHSQLVCDEFLAKLDRTTAKVVAFNIRKLVTKNNLILGIATTHEDILEDLGADHVVRFSGTTATVERGVRPKAAPWPGALPLSAALVPIGPTSLDGTTAAQV